MNSEKQIMNLAPISEDGNQRQHRDVDFFHERGEVGRKPALKCRSQNELQKALSHK